MAPRPLSHALMLGRRRPLQRDCHNRVASAMVELRLTRSRLYNEVFAVGAMMKMCHLRSSVKLWHGLRPKVAWLHLWTTLAARSFSRGTARAMH